MKTPWGKPKPESLHVELPPARCPSCGSLNDGATSVELDGAIPKPGDIAICGYCRELLQYEGEALALVRLEGEDRVLALADPKIKAALRALFEMAHPPPSPWTIGKG
jgi:hypothetical protein